MAVLAKARRRSAGPAPVQVERGPHVLEERRGDERRGVLLVERLSPRRLVDRLLNCFGRRRGGRFDGCLGRRLGLRLRSKRGAGLRLRRFDGEAGWLPDGMIDGAALPVAVRRLCSDVPRGRGCAFVVSHSGRAGEHSGAERHSAGTAPLSTVMGLWRGALLQRVGGPPGSVPRRPVGTRTLASLCGFFTASCAFLTNSPGLRT